MGSFYIQNVFAAPRTLLEELTALPQIPYLVGRGLAALSPKTPPPL